MIAAEAREMVGLVIDGAVRDTEAIAVHHFPVLSRGLAIGACTKERAGRLNIPIQLGGATAPPSDIVVGDADGVVIIEQQRAEEVYQAAWNRRQRESRPSRSLVAVIPRWSCEGADARRSPGGGAKRD